MRFIGWIGRGCMGGMSNRNILSIIHRVIV